LLAQLRDENLDGRAGRDCARKVGPRCMRRKEIKRVRVY